MLVIGAAARGAWPAGPAERRGGRLREAAVERLGIGRTPWSRMVEVLAPGVGAVVHPGRPLI